MSGKEAYQLRTAIVLVGGRGQRLRPITARIPKCLVQVCSRPFLDWILEWLTANRISNLIFGIAYRKEDVVRHLKDSNLRDVSIRFSEHSIHDGTSTAIRKAFRNANVDDDHVLVMNGDNIVGMSLERMVRLHLRENTVATILAVPLQCRFGVLEIQGDKVVSFNEKPTLYGISVNGGVYIFSKRIIRFLEDGNIEKSVLPNLARRGELSAYMHDGFWATVNTPRDIEELERRFSEDSLKAALLNNWL